MFDLFAKLSASDKLQVISIVSTAVISIASILIAVFTLRQTNKITEEANRPYVVIFLDLIQVTSTFSYHLVLKNFGNTGAMIDSITYTPDFKSKYGNSPFSTFENHFIAPGQSITTSCSFEKPYQEITFTICYRQGKKSYTDSFVINPNVFSDLIINKVAPGNSTNLEKIIAYSAQELIRTRL